MNAHTHALAAVEDFLESFKQCGSYNTRFDTYVIRKGWMFALIVDILGG